jgi:hypothetical protein
MPIPDPNDPNSWLFGSALPSALVPVPRPPIPTTTPSFGSPANAMRAIMGSAVPTTTVPAGMVPQTPLGTNPVLPATMGPMPAMAAQQATPRAIPNLPPAVNAAAGGTWNPQWAYAIGQIESGNRYDNTTTTSKGTAYGRYQVMGSDLADWTRQALGHSMTPQQFLGSKFAQDAVFQKIFGDYVQKYGPGGAARAWFAGERGMNNPNAKDPLGTTVAGYERTFNTLMGQPPTTSLTTPMSATTPTVTPAPASPNVATVPGAVPAATTVGGLLGGGSGLLGLGGQNVGLLAKLGIVNSPGLGSLFATQPKTLGPPQTTTQVANQLALNNQTPSTTPLRLGIQGTFSPQDRFSQTTPSSYYTQLPPPAGGGFPGPLDLPLWWWDRQTSWGV